MPRMKTALRRLPVMLAALALLGAPGQARQWSRNPISQAQDYAVISDNRGGGDLVLVIWLAPPVIPATPQSQAARDLLDKYVMIGVTHAHTQPDGSMSFDAVHELDAKGADGKALVALDTHTLPPAMVGAMSAMQTAFARSLGALGQGTHWFAFEAGSVHACGKGGLTVPFAGENYTYTTPMPNCS
jgi:hypothetical protein